jgi:hypothetical protein
MSSNPKTTKKKCTLGCVCCIKKDLPGLGGTEQRVRSGEQGTKKRTFFQNPHLFSPRGDTLPSIHWARLPSSQPGPHTTQDPWGRDLWRSLKSEPFFHMPGLVSEPQQPQAPRVSVIFLSFPVFCWSAMPGGADALQFKRTIKSMY